MTNFYQIHQNLIKEFKLKYPKEIPEMRIFERHVGLFYNRQGSPIKINKKGMADLYGIIKLNGVMIHIEIEAKTGSSRQSSEQKKWQKFVEKFDGKYFIMRNADETIKEIRKYIDQRLQNDYN